MKTRPVTLNLSIFYPPVDSTNFEMVLSDVMLPVHKLLCDNSFQLITSTHNGGSLCPPSSKHHTILDAEAPDFGDAKETVLQAIPVSAKDYVHEDVEWTTWKTSFYVLQVGSDMIEMAEAGGEPIVNGMEASRVIEEVLKLAFEVSILDGTLDTELSDILPGAHISLQGDERSTWARYHVFHEDPNWSETLSNGTPQHQLLDTLNSITSKKNPHPVGTSIVASALMDESKLLRYFGLAMFVLVAGFWTVLARIGKRRKIEEAHLEEALLAKTNRRNEIELHSVDLGDADNVSVILRSSNFVIESGCQ